MTENELSNIIIGCAIEVHKQLGPGLLESAYRECLAYELSQYGLSVFKEVPMPITYKEIRLNHGYRMDLLVNNLVALNLNPSNLFQKFTKHNY